MSCNNNYLSNYSSYYNNHCKSNNCQQCQPLYYPQQQCQQPCIIPCPQPIQNCPQVTFISNIATSTTVVAGGVAIPVGTVIGAGVTTVPVGTVTVITGFTGSPTSNMGGIISNNGFFTAPIAGR